MASAEVAAKVVEPVDSQKEVPQYQRSPPLAAVSPERASGETRDAYRYMREVGGIGEVARVVQLFSLRAGSMRRMIRAWELSNWMGREPRRTRELVAVVVSRLNNCHY